MVFLSFKQKARKLFSSWRGRKDEEKNFPAAVIEPSSLPRKSNSDLVIVSIESELAAIMERVCYGKASE